MLFMNEHEIESAVLLFEDDEVLGPASRTLANLRDAANANSDGWAYWPKPCRAARKLQELLQDAERAAYRREVLPDLAQRYKAALAPIKAFRTREHIDFKIEEI